MQNECLERLSVADHYQPYCSCRRPLVHVLIHGESSEGLQRCIQTIPCLTKTFRKDVIIAP